MGDLREFILEQLTNKELRQSYGHISPEVVNELLGVCGDNLQLLNLMISERAFSRDGV